MPERAKLTKTRCDAAEYPHEVDDTRNAPRYVLWDTECKGFGLRVYPSGRKVFVVKMKVRGRQRWMTLGEPGAMVHDDAKDETVPLTATKARTLAQRHQALAEAGKDPVEERKRQRAEGTTVKELAESYLEADVRGVLKPSTVTSYENYVSHVVDEFGDVTPGEITERDVKRWQRSMSDEPYGANRRLWMLSKLMDEAAKAKLRPKGTNPCEYVDRYPEQEHSEPLSAAELGRLGKALRKLEGQGKVSPHAAGAIRLLLLTGARKGEILGLRWEDVDFERGRITIRDHKTSRRTADPKHVPITPAVRDVLDGLPRTDGHEWVIEGQRKGKPMTTLRRPWVRACKAAKVEGRRIHDLRHTVGSHAVSSGMSLPLVAAILGHASTKSTERYSREKQQDALTEAASGVAAGIKAAMEADTADVVDLDEARGQG